MNKTVMCNRCHRYTPRNKVGSGWNNAVILPVSLPMIFDEKTLEITALLCPSCTSAFAEFMDGPKVYDQYL